MSRDYLSLVAMVHGKDKAAKMKKVLDDPSQSGRGEKMDDILGEPLSYTNTRFNGKSSPIGSRPKFAKEVKDSDSSAEE